MDENTITICVSEEMEESRLDKCLLSYMDSLSRTYLQKLIKEEWTTDVTLTTDENGLCTLEGFKGKYVASCGGKQGQVMLKAGSEGVAEVKLS